LTQTNPPHTVPTPSLEKPPAFETENPDNPPPYIPVFFSESSAKWLGDAVRGRGRVSDRVVTAWEAASRCGV